MGGHSQRAVCLIGIFPPAGGGQAAVNDFYRRTFVEASARVSVINISPPVGPRVWYRSLVRAARVAWGLPRLVALCLVGAADSIYLGVSGHRGQLYDVLFVCMARLCKANLILHHDSYRYINRRSRLADVLFRFAGARAMHIVLCEDMSRRLYRQYPSAMRRIVIANAASTDEPAHSPGERQAPRAIGFISNITRAKGIFEFLTVAERVHQLRPEVRAVLAGPLHEKAIERALSERLRAAPWIEYVGPLYGNDKSRFYGAIDVLVFPTRHADEADPNVVNEASAHGVVVISRSRGCISEMLWAGGGVSIDDDADFEALAERTIVRWCDEPESFALVSRAAIGSHLAASQIHRKRLAGLVDDLTGPMAPLTR